MATHYLTSWDAAEFTVISGVDPFQDFNDATAASVGSIFTVGQAELLTISDGDNRFDETDSDQEFISSSDPDGRNATPGTDIDPEYTYRIRPVGGASDGSQDILIHAYEMGIGPGADGTVASAWLEPGQQYEVMELVSENPDIAYGAIYVCFTGETRICTANGMRRAQSLTRGDLVWTADAGFRPIRWIGKRYVSGQTLRANPQARPVRIERGALSRGLPLKPVEVSPQHRILLRSPVVERMFGVDEVLVAARHLAGLPGIGISPRAGGVTYVHFMLDTHHVVEAEGMLTESLLPGPEARRALDPDEVDEIAALFPMAAALWRDGAMQPARPIVKGPRLRNLLRRLVKNRKLLFEDEPAASRAAAMR